MYVVTSEAPQSHGVLILSRQADGYSLIRNVCFPNAAAASEC
jgi:hypothetical protein